MRLDAETRNCVRRCWRTAHWSDGARLLFAPLRSSLYRTVRRLPRFVLGFPGTSLTAARVVPPATAATVSVATEEVSGNWKAVSGLDLLFAEVDCQLRGDYRLAGGRRQSLAAAAVRDLPDLEDRHAFHRLYWAARYARAAAFGHTRAAAGLTRDFAAWLALAPDRDPVAMAPYTVAERIASLAECLRWLRPRRPAPELSAIEDCVPRDAAYLAGHIEYALGVHNHLLNDARALYLAGVLCAGRREAGAWRHLAFEIWDEFFPRLVLDDGALAEDSSHYHLLLCRTALEYWLAARREEHPLPAGFEPALHRLFRLANDLLRPDSSLPRFGDISPDRTVSDLWGLLAAAYHHGLLPDVPRHRAVTPLTLYYSAAVPTLPPASPPSGTSLYDCGGYAFLRAGSFELAAHGYRGPSAAVHGDAGCGSFELWARGHVLVREPGAFLSPSDPRCRWYRSAAAQNVTTLDGIAPGIAWTGSVPLPPWYLASCGAEWTCPEPSSLRFRSDSFARLRPGVTLSRTWTARGGDLFLEEEIGGYGGVDWMSHLHLGDAAWAPLDGEDGRNRRAFACRLPDASQARMFIDVPPEVSVSLDPAPFLVEYGVERPGRVLRLGARRRLPFRWSVRWQFLPAAGAPAAEEIVSTAAWR